MAPLEPTSQTPTRIPRPTFMATSPRSPSIRAVPYSHMDGIIMASETPGTYSPSSWPFPKSVKSSSLDFSATTPKHDDAGTSNAWKMKLTEEALSSPRATTSATSAMPVAGNLRGSVQERLSGGHAFENVPLGSVETQIYPPAQGSKDLCGQHSRPVGAKGEFLEPAMLAPERPMSPTPYSLLRKVSELSEPDSEDGSSLHGGQKPIFVSQQATTRHLSATPISQGSSSQPGPSSGVVIAKEGVSSAPTALTAPTVRDEEGRVLSRLHPIAGSGLAHYQPQDVEYMPTVSSLQAENGSNNEDDGIIIFRPGETTGVPPAVGTSTPRINSFHSRRATTIHEACPDLESLRRGPRIRHARLPLSPSMAAKAGRKIPESTKKLWTSLGVSRKMMIASAVLLELSLFSFVSSITAVIVSQADRGYPSTGLVAWAVVSSVFVVISGGLLGFAFLHYLKTNEDVVSGEDWIEMHIRSRPLPPRPKSEQQRRQDTGATEAWRKFAVDHEQLRHYVEFLESRIGVLEEGQPSGTQSQQPDGPSATVSGTNTPTGINRRHPSSTTTTTPKQTTVNTPKPIHKQPTIGGSISRRQLLQPEDPAEGSSSANDPDRGAMLFPKSDTKASILTELCEAVTEGYSPLSEQMPRGSLHIPQTPTPTLENLQTPCAARGGSGNTALRHLVLPCKVATEQQQQQQRAAGQPAPAI